MRGLRHTGVLVDFCEACDDGPAVIVGDGFDFCLCGCERLWGNGSVCVKEGLDEFGYGALEEPCVVVDEVGEAVFIEGGVDLLDDGSLDEGTCIECDKIVFETSPGVFDLCSCGVQQIWQDGKDGAVERDARGDALVGGGAADQAEVSLETATEGGTNGLAVGLAFSLEFGETRVGRIAIDFRQRGMLEVALTVVYVGDRHCLCRGPVVVGADNSVCSVTMVKLLSLSGAY